MSKNKLLIIIFLLVSLKSYAQNNLTSNLYFSPHLTIGYTFGTGLNYGVDLTFGIFKLKNDNPEINGALSLQYYFVNYMGSTHRLFTVNLVAESDYYRLALGAGDTKKKWGFRRINKSKAFGYHFDFGISTVSTYTPWLGLKVFAIHGGYWEFYNKPYYMSTVMYFRQSPYYPWGKLQ